MKGYSGNTGSQLQEYIHFSRNNDALAHELSAELIEVYKELDFDSIFALLGDHYAIKCELQFKVEKPAKFEKIYIYDYIIYYYYYSTYFFSTLES